MGTVKLLKPLPQKPEDRAAIVDEFGKLESKVRRFKPIVERRAKLLAQMQNWAEKLPAGEKLTVDGREFVATISERKLERSITNMPKLFTLMGKAAFLQICSVSVKKIAGLISKEHHEKFMVEERTGTRTVEVVVRSESGEAPKAA